MQQETNLRERHGPPACDLCDTGTRTLITILVVLRMGAHGGIAFLLGRVIIFLTPMDPVVAYLVTYQRSAGPADEKAAGQKLEPAWTRAPEMSRRPADVPHVGTVGWWRTGMPGAGAAVGRSPTGLPGEIDVIRFVVRPMQPLSPLSPSRRRSWRRGSGRRCAVGPGRIRPSRPNPTRRET